MNRPIKFRAWHDGMMYEVYALVFNASGIQEAHMQNTKTFYRYHTNNLDTCVLMQSTGLVDKDGTEIFEGDIVRIGSRVHEIVFKDGAFVIMLTLVHDGSLFYLDARHDFLNMEIIGNRYENPELLEGICTASN